MLVVTESKEVENRVMSRYENRFFPFFDSQYSDAEKLMWKFVANKTLSFYKSMNEIKNLVMQFLGLHNNKTHHFCFFLEFFGH